MKARHFLVTTLHGEAYRSASQPPQNQWNWRQPCGKCRLACLWRRSGCTSGPPEVTQYNFTPSLRGKGKAKTRKKVALAAVQQFYSFHWTEADMLVLTGAGRA